MAVEVVLPKVDMDMEGGVIAAWHVAEGDRVAQGDILFDMETDKSVMEVEAPASGRIRDLTAITGETIAVGTPVAWIDEGDDDERPLPAAQAASAEPAATAPPASRDAAIVSAPSDPVAHAAGAPSAAAGVRATPLARSTARTEGVALEAIQGSGPRGRIVAQDVQAHLAARAPMAKAGAAADAQPVAERVPFTAIRRLVAGRLAESARTAPHFYLTAHIEMTALLAALEREGPAIQAQAGAKPSVTALMVYLAARALRRHPLLNASVDGDAARLHAAAHIGVAMEREGDLVVPVIRDASTRTLPEIVREFARLRDAVRSRGLPPSEMKGGTFTISNLGMYGVDAFTAIINPPESAILAIGRTVDTPVGRAGQVVLRPMATLTLSSDHRIVDGTTAARFMSDLRSAIEEPGSLA